MLSIASNGNENLLGAIFIPKIKTKKEVNSMRKFLILDEKTDCGKVTSLVIKGIVESDMYPSYDKDTALKKFGVSYPKVVEVTSHCNIKLI